MSEFIISNIDEFNTSEGYFGDAYLKDDCITIPYINVGLMTKHPLNHCDQQIFIDFCFLQIINPKYVSIYKKGIIKNTLEVYSTNKSKFFGGVFIGNDSTLDNEMEIQASEVLLIIPKGFKSSTNIWIPNFKDYKGRGNLEEIDVINFLKKTKDIKKVTANFNNGSN